MIDKFALLFTHLGLLWLLVLVVQQQVTPRQHNKKNTATESQSEHSR